jgi:uncharacterized protein (TIGR02611 family)
MIRVIRIGAGLGLVVLGLFLLVLPGPGILTIAAGLALLRTEYEWARNLLDWMKTRYRQYFTKGEPTGEGAPDDRRDAQIG